MTQNASKIALLIIALFSVVIIIIQRWQGHEGDAWQEVITSDGLGYYEYLPAIFISGDFGTQQDSLAQRMLVANSIVQSENSVMIKYFAGTALLQTPFFALGQLWADLSGKKTDGYSEPYQKMISIAGLFYLLLGLWWLRALLRSFECSEMVMASTLLLLFFGTGLLYYALMQPAMSHVYSFCLISGFMLFLRKAALQKSDSYFILAGVLWALVILVRPVNGLAVLATPFLMPTASWREWIKVKWNLRKSGTLVGALFFLILAIQPLLWKMQSGAFFTWPYTGEGFNWTRPQVWDFLFSIRKGLFLYTPVLLLALLGLLHLLRKDKMRALHFFIYLVAVIYVSSSWWNWYYGDSFGQRVLIDHFALFALLMAFGLQALQANWQKVAVGSIAALLIALNLVQSWQYEHNILDRFNMNAEKYSFVFLKTGEKFEEVLGGYNDMLGYGEPEILLTASTDMEVMSSHFSAGSLLEDTDLAFSGKMVNELTEEAPYSTTFVYPASREELGKHLYLEVDLKRLQPEALGSEHALGVAAISSPDEKNWCYKTFRMNDVPPQDVGEWKQMHYTVALPPFRTENDVLKFFIWNIEGQHFYLDDMHVTLQAIK